MSTLESWKNTISKTELSKICFGAGVYISGLASVSTVLTSYFLFLFMNNPHELGVEACRQNFWLCPWRQRYLWPKTRMLLQLWSSCCVLKQLAKERLYLWPCYRWLQGMKECQVCVPLNHFNTEDCLVFIQKVKQMIDVVVMLEVQKGHDARGNWRVDTSGNT